MPLIQQQRKRLQLDQQLILLIYTTTTTITGVSNSAGCVGLICKSMPVGGPHFLKIANTVV